MLHIAVNFVTGILLSDRNTTTLTMVDIFFKAVHFILLPKLHSAEDTGDLLVWHVFLLHRLPRDIVSDIGPQFTSQVWRAFNGVLGSWVSLSSGYHSQSNSQTERINQTLETPYNLWLFNTSHPGVRSCPALNMPTTLWCRPPLGCLPSWPALVTQTGLGNWVTAGVCGNGSVVSSMCSSSQSQRQAWTPLLIISLPLSTLFSIVVIIKCLPVDCMFTN